MAINFTTLSWADQYQQAKDMPGFLSHLSSESFDQSDNKGLALDFGKAITHQVIHEDVRQVAPDYTNSPNSREVRPPATKPTVLSVSPTKAHAGQQFIIKGSYPSPPTLVEFNSISRSNFELLSNSELLVTIPPEASSGALRIFSEEKLADNKPFFEVLSGPAPPIQKLQAPTFAPTPGAYEGSLNVFILTDGQPGQIYYTLDGSIPDRTSLSYTGPITVKRDTQINAILMATNFTNSDVATGVYTITTPPPPPTQLTAPTFTPSGGNFTGNVSVTMSHTTAGVTLHYTTNNSTPTTTSPIYSTPVFVDITTTLKAIAVKSGFTNSPVTTSTYTITDTTAKLPTPTFAPLPGTFSSSVMVTISRSGSEGQIRYTTDGTTPGASSILYTAPINLTVTTTLKAITVPGVQP